MLPNILQNLRIPVIAAPLFIISNPQLVIAQCKAGVIGSMPALNARPKDQLEVELKQITEELDRYNQKNPDNTAAPFAINQIVHKSNERLMYDVEMCMKYRVPITITSLGARVELNDAMHSVGGITLHDVINNKFAKKAIETGADVLIAVATGAGGHAGRLSPFPLISEIRCWYNGPLALSGAVASGDAVLAAQAMGADFGYIGSAFIATKEARADEKYKQMIVDSKADDIIYSNLFTGVHGNYLAPSVKAAGMDPNNLPEGDISTMDFDNWEKKPKAWKEIWGCGQGIGSVTSVLNVEELVARLEVEYLNARSRISASQ